MVGSVVKIIESFKCEGKRYTHECAVKTSLSDNNICVMSGKTLQWFGFFLVGNGNIFYRTSS